MKKIFAFFFLIIILTGCGKEKLNESEKEKVIVDETSMFVKETKEEIDVYSDVYIDDIISYDSSINVLNKDLKIDTNSLGKKTIEVSYLKDKEEHLYKFDINVVDNVPPLVFSSTYKYVTVGSTTSLCDLILYGDNFTKKVECTVEGDYDLNHLGEYYLTYVLKDEAGNITRESGTVSVVVPSEGDGDYYYEPTILNFSEVYNRYKTSETEVGIDVSEFQDKIDFNKVKEAGASFVIIRAGFQGTESKKLNTDAEFKENLKNAKEAGLKVGVYFYSVASSIKEAKEQAEYVIDLLDGEDLDLGITLDWENWTDWNTYNISFHDLDEILNEFVKTVNKKGYTGVLYGSKYYLENIWENKQNHTVWLAHWVDESSYKGPYKIWQIGDGGLIDGINGYTDVDILFQ